MNAGQGQMMAGRAVNNGPLKGPPSSPVEAATVQLASLVNSLDAKIRNIGERLTPVLAPPTPMPTVAKGPGDHDHRTVPLCVDIDMQSEKIRQILEYLQDIEERLGL